MIILFPMLTSKSVSPHVIPGICKTLEKFVLVYKMNDILHAAGIVGATFGTMKAAAASMLMFRQNESHQGKVDNTPLPGYKPPGKTKETPELPDASGFYQSDRDEFRSDERSRQGAEKNEIARQKARADVLGDLQADFGKVDINFPQTQTMTIEPTWVTLSTRRGTMVLGIKVIAFPIDSDTNIIKLMTTDLDKLGVGRYIEQYKRKVIRIILGLARTFHIPFVGSKIITDDAAKAVLFAKTEHGRNIFVCLNYSDINNSKMLLNAVNVSKLFKLGWTSFITCDDVNKRAIFCMDDFKGMCSMVPYSFLHASVSKDINKAYDDLDDVKSSASPFFRMSISKKKVVGESVAYQKLNDYLKVLSGD